MLGLGDDTPSVAAGYHAEQPAPQAAHGACFSADTTPCQDSLLVFDCQRYMNMHAVLHTSPSVISVSNMHDSTIVNGHSLSALCAWF